MRTIKFRVWAENTEFPNGKMYVDKFLLNLNGDLIFTDRKGYFDYSMTFARISFNNLNLMQFTGLQDRDGNNVYEGDILETSDRILKVVWHNYAGQWDTDFIRYKGELLSNGLQNLEWKYRATIIGNIYENPELLSTPTAVL